MITTSSSTSTSTITPLTKASAPSSSAGTKSTGSSFDQQLSQALSESLQRLGLSSGQVNISIKNNAGSLTSRQIVITYDEDAASSASSSSVLPSAKTTESPTTTTTAKLNTLPVTSEPTSAPTSTAGNPFLAPMSVKVASPSPAREPISTDWSPYTGPRDQRDAIPVGGGKVTASGAPDIQINSDPARNQYKYTGPAATNPYFTNPGNPLRDGYVLGFDNWFQDATISGSKNGLIPANRSYFATEEGAQEALRLVQQYTPGASLTQKAWGGGGVFGSSTPMWSISLPDGKTLNAGGILRSYYNGGTGVTIGSDSELQQILQSA